jgi:uncharacterized membrane protein YGL010W
MVKTQTETSTDVETKDIVPLFYRRLPSEPIFAFKNFYINYGRFHSEPTNQAIHLIFIPMIGFTLSGLVHFLEYSIIVDSKDQTLLFMKGDNSNILAMPNKHYIDLMQIIITALCVTYMFVEPVFGILSYTIYQIMY